MAVGCVSMEFVTSLGHGSQLATAFSATGLEPSLIGMLA
jgi:hypothetical protein